ncbi:PQQ-binding-like beta-propeller repeat protein [Nonomuraea sp. NPDC049141]|uniref:outer membrane protein assembly factor BamB family protein n=1 Tax=Nonomuraea sp. NPDC049141 TaxID=3155500 RepID=UPI0033C3F0E9
MRRLVGVPLLALMTCLALVSDAPAVVRKAVGWRAEWSAAFDNRSFGLTEDAIVYSHTLVASERALAVAARIGRILILDPVTGRVLSTVPAEPRLGDVRELWVADEALVVLREQPGRTGAEFEGVLTGYDLATGQRLWGWRLAREAVVTRRAVAALTASDVQLLDARTGATRAVMPVLQGCTAAAAAADELVAVLELCANDRVHLAAVDPETGRPYWTRDLTYRRPQQWPPAEGADPRTDMGVATAADGTVLVHLSDTPYLYASDGRRLPAGIHGEATRSPIITGEGVVINTSIPDGGGYVQGIDPATVAIRWTRGVAGSTSFIATGDLFVTKSGNYPGLEPWPLNAYLLAIDAATGEASELPLPATGGATFLEGGAGGLVFVSTPTRDDDSTGVKNGTRITAYRLVRANRAPANPPGVAPAADWPDACGLLTDRDLSLLAPGYLAYPHARTLAGSPLPKPAVCDWIPPTDKGDVVSVSVTWTAPSTSEARRLAAEEVRYGLDTTIKGRDGPDIVYYQLGHPAGDQYGALVSVGPVVTKLVASTPETVRRLAPRLRDNLRTSAGPRHGHRS